jgi:RNA polymerase sigma-70 factor (ECF subfamily)
MDETASKQSASAGAPGFFEVTSWKTVLEARQGDSQGTQALERLLSRYYRPMERIIQMERRCGPDDARDLTQEFIKECLRRDFLQEVSPDKGRFRTFIRRCIANFLHDVHDKASAQKRGGGQTPLSLDHVDEDGRSLLDPPAEGVDPGLALDRAWGQQVVANALEALERECITARRHEFFRELRSQLTGSDDAVATAAIAARFGLTSGAVDVARHRLRQRFGEHLVEEIKATIADGADWREELRYLMELVRS